MFKKNKASFFCIFLISTCLVFFVACTIGSTQTKKQNVIEQMHTKWQGKWPKNMQFEQYVYFYENDSIVRTEIWQELLSSPQNLHIRFNGFETGSGMLFTNDSIYNFKNFKLVNAQKKVHQLLLLGFDVYHQSPEVTVEKLLALGFNLEEKHEITHQKDTLIIVGTCQKGNLESNQFWINKKQLYLERVILTSNTTKSDITFENYQWFENYPVATVVTFSVNNKLLMREEYFNISFPEKVEPKIFSSINFPHLISF
jgi:hypothetical protein